MTTKKKTKRPAKKTPRRAPRKTPRETSDELSTLANKAMRLAQHHPKRMRVLSWFDPDEFLTIGELESMAGSLLGQDQHRGRRGK